MCAIFGSFSKEKFIELAALNSYRGQHSFSISIYDPNIRWIQIIEKKVGPFNASAIDEYADNTVFFIGHIQAPTTDAKTTDNIHPSIVENTLLWHNGIIKADCIEKMQEALVDSNPWDTHLLHKWVRANNPLSEIDGTFSCLNYDKGVLYLFRNEISPMFCDEQLNISSTKFDTAIKTPPNTLLEMVFSRKSLVKIGSFSTKENPYYFEFGV